MVVSVVVCCTGHIATCGGVILTIVEATAALVVWATASLVGREVVEHPAYGIISCNRGLSGLDSGGRIIHRPGNLTATSRIQFLISHHFLAKTGVIVVGQFVLFHEVGPVGIGHGLEESMFQFVISQDFVGSLVEIGKVTGQHVGLLEKFRVGIDLHIHRKSDLAKVALLNAEGFALGYLHSDQVIDTSIKVVIGLGDSINDRRPL